MSETVTITPTWPVPTPAQIANNAAVVYETSIPGIDARSANSVAATNTRIVAMTAYDLYNMQANLAQELLPSTANAWLWLHAAIWNVPQLQPTPSTGSASFTAGSAGATVPAGATLTAPSGALYMTTSSVTIAANATASVPVTAAIGGTAGNLPAGTTLGVVSAISGLAAQSGVLTGLGSTGGANLESNASWRGRILQAIRSPVDGGSGTDYEQWAQDAGAPIVNVVGGAIGAGSVGVYIAASGPTAASPTLVAAVQNYIGVYGTNGGVRPVTANVQVMAATLVPVFFTLSLNPNTPANQAIANNALSLFFGQNPQIGATCFVTQADYAIASAAGGEFTFDRLSPSVDVTATQSQLLTFGGIAFE